VAAERGGDVFMLSFDHPSNPLGNPLCNPFLNQLNQEKLARLNPQWIDSIVAAERGEDVLAGTPGLQRPDGDVEIGEEFLRKGLFRVRCQRRLGFLILLLALFLMKPSC
jgi:hypothetical protein